MGNMLFEVTPLNNGVPTTLRMASAFADSSSTQLNGYQWLPLITQQPTREITLSDDGLLDTISVSHGSIQFWMSPDFNNEAWSNYEWTGATCNIYTGNVGDPFASYTPYLLGGEVSSLSRDGINASLELLGADASLNVPLLSLEYAGTGGVEGQTTTKGKLKPRAIGRPQSVEPILLDSTKWIYQVHGYGAVSSIKVYDFAIALDAAKNKGDAADYAALAALTLSPGDWATCTAQGLFRLGATPKNKISADVVMPGANTIEAAAKAMLKVAGIVDARIGDFSAFQQTWSLYQTEARSVGDAVRDLMYQAGGYLIANSNGVWQAGDYFAAKTPTSISTDGTLPLVLDVKELPAAAPVYKVSIGYDRCFGVHSDSDVSPALSDVSDATVASAAAAAAAQQTADQATSDAKAANDRLTTISSDGWLDRSDKAQVVREFQQESAQQSGLVNQGTSLNVTPQRDTLTSKFNALKSYLEGLSPAYTDFSKDTQIVQSTWLARWGDYYVAKQNLTNALAGKAATVSTWTGTTGVGKPADFATSGESILLDQDFTLTFASGLGTYWQTGSSAVTVDATGGVNGTPALRYTPNGNILDVMPANWTQCVAGDTFFVNARVYISADFNGSTGGMFATTCQNVSNTNTYPSSDIGNIAARDTWTTVSGKLTISGDVVRFKPRLSVRNDATVGYVLINNVTYQRVQKNATEGAPSGTYVGSGTGRVLAENIAGAVNTLGNAGFLDTTAPGVPAGLALASTLTDAGVTLDASWTARTETDLAGYKISLREGSGNTIEFTTTKASYQWTALKRNTAYTAQVAAYDKAGNVSSFSTAVAITTARDTVAPAVPTALAGTSAFSTTFLSWSNPTDNDLAAVEIWSATSNDSTKATLLSTEAARPSAQATFTHSGLTSGSTLYYWLKAVDTSGNKSGFSASSGGVSVKYVDITDVAPAVNQGLTKTVTALPNPTNYIGASLVLYQGVLYRYVNSAWTKAVSTADFDKKITGSLIEAKTITGDNLEVGTIKAAQIGAGEIVASKLAIGNTDNIIPDADMRELSFWVGDTPPSSMYVNDQNSGWAFRRYLGMTAPGSFDRFGKLFPVEPGATYKVKVATYIGGDMKGWFNPVIHMPNVQWFSLKTGKPMDPSVANATDGYVDTNYDNRGVEFTYTNPTGITNNLNRNWQFRFMGNMTAGYVEFMVSITRVSDVTLIADGAVTTTKIIVNSLDGDRIKVGTLDADKIKANTVLSNLVTVSGTTGNIGDAVLRASDPASRINEYTTNIQPGKITIQGGTSLNDWRDQTFIKGGALKTNSVTADKLTINSRGISAEGIDFEVKPISGGAELTWGSGGSIRYIADDGSVQSRTIDASSTYGTVKPCLVYWIVGETALRSSNSSAAVISNPNAVVMGTYTGGNIFNMNYGGTVINGERITTGTIDANRIKAGSIITGDLTVNGSGTLSTAFTTATWSGVSGTGKPADNATANGPGDALNRNSSFSLAANANGTLPGWIEEGYTGTQQLTRYVTTGGTGVGFGLLSGREAMYSEPIPAQSSDVLFYKLWLGLNSGYNGSQAAGDTAQCQAMIRYYDGANNQVAEKIIFQDANWQGGTGFRVYTGKTDAAPAGTAYARLWYVQDLSRDNASKAGMFLQYFGVSRADYGATVGAPSGTKVGNMDADSLVLDLNNITNDNVLSRAEKSQLIVEWSKIDSNRNKYDAQANALGVDSLPMRQAHQNLANMLTGISGGWSNYTVDSPIDGNNFRNTFNAYYIAETALVTAIQAKAATLANWNGVAGAGKPETYNVCAKGNSTGNNVPSNYAHGMRDASGNVFIDSYNPGLRSDSYVRSYTLMWRINASYWAIRHYDVYGNGEVKYPNPENRHGAEGMAAQINDIGFGTPVVIYTSDEPAQNRLTTSLATQMYGCGASRSVWGAASFAYRSGYVLIGQKGAGDGNGVELQCGDGQYVMGSFSIVNGVLTVGGKSIKDANDLAFSDGRSVNTLYQVEAGATVGAPNGTFIGSGATRVSVESVVGTISAITDDNIISPAEKTPLYNQFQNAVQDEAKTYARISDYVNVSKGNRYECQIKRDQMSSAKNEVINSLAGVFDDMGAATNVNGARIRNAFQAFYEKYAIAEKALQYLAAESADFDQVTGSNKPENNATRGAPSGTNIGNTLAQDVEARANDPANRINNNTTTISGGKITANTVTAEKLTINSRGISFIGLNFEWNPRDNKVYWSEGYVYFVNDAGGEAQEYIPAGNTNGAQPHLWFFWYPGAGAIGFNQANPARPGVITLASWWGGNNLNVTYGGTVINGNKITTGTVQADKLAVGTLSAITADVGTLTAGTIKNASGSTNFDVTNGRITFNNGSVMKVSGAGFGSSGQFIEWFGPVQSSLNNCTEANAVSYLKTNGSAYFGGTLSAGVTKNAVNTTSQATNANVTTGKVGSRGGTRVVVVSYNWNSNVSVNKTQQASDGTNLAASVILRRNGADIATLNASGTWSRTQAFSAEEPGSYSESIGGSLTFTDNSGGSEVEYSAFLVSRTLGPGPQNGTTAQAFSSQQISIVQTEN